jgi:superfamily II DNA or RNA helicase
VDSVKVWLNTRSIVDYRKFLRIKALPAYKFTGHEAEFLDEYMTQVYGYDQRIAVANGHDVSAWLFDYQRDIAKIAIEKRKYAVFADCGLGKTAILLEFAFAARRRLSSSKRVLIVCPLMVIRQTMAEAEKFYGDDGKQIEQVKAANLSQWLAAGDGGIGITNYDSLTDEITQGNLGALILDESSMLKSHYGKWGQKCIDLGRGLDWKLCCTGTPAPNDRIEYANHAVFLDHFPTVNSFLARFFVNRGQTDNRWELKPHALEPFYRALSHWAIFLTNPATYGWKDNCGTVPPIRVHVEDVPLTLEQETAVRKLTGKLVVTSLGGITSRSVMGQLAKGSNRGEAIDTNKFAHIRKIFDREPDRSTIIWCHYNDEQKRCYAEFPEAANIDGSTPESKRTQLIDEFKAGARKVLISKPRILGFGLNLQVATRQIFSGLQDSYEEYYQAVKRSNRIGSTHPLDVHIPVTEIERPMIETVLRKAAMVEADTKEQERIFKLYSSKVAT